MNKYLGLIRCDSGNRVIFPNTLQHRVKEFKNTPNEWDVGLRSIIAFFLIDPNEKIVSTSDVPDQRSIISLKQAETNR